MWTRREEMIQSSRYQYKNSYEYAISVVNLCIGVNKLFNFPSKVFENGGGAFFISYAVMILLLGYPVLYLELILGQFHRCSSAIFIRRCVPLLQGFGCLAMISALATLNEHQFSLAVILKFVVSLTMYQWKDLPDSTCDNVWNTDECYEFFSKQCPDLKKAHILFQNKCVNDIQFIPSGPYFAHSMYPVLLREVANNTNLWAFLHYTCQALSIWKSSALILKTIAVTVADIFNISMKSFKFDLLFALLAAFLSFSGLILFFEGGIFYASMIASIQRISTGAFITVLMIVVIEFYGLKTIYEDIYNLMGRPSKEQWSCIYAWSFWEWRWRMVPAFSMLYIIYQFYLSYDSKTNDLVYYYSYDIILFTVLFLIIVFLFASAYYSYLKMLHHFEEKERNKRFRFKCLVSLQRHLRSWEWIANDKKLIDEELPDSEPEDSDGFWKREYINFFDFSDEANNVKKGRTETSCK